VAHLSPALARRVDRLARRAHAFHRWAHHPVCARYAGEVIRLGHRTRLCRGCLLAGFGAAAGLAAGLAAPAFPGLGHAFLTGAALALPGWSLRRPAPAGPGAPDAPDAARRTPKLVTRLLPTALAGVVVGQARSGAPVALGAAALALAAIAAALIRYRRRGPDRRACEGCPQGPPAATCPGFAPLVARERALQRLAGRWIAAEGRRA